MYSALYRRRLGEMGRDHVPRHVAAVPAPPDGQVPLLGPLVQQRQLPGREGPGAGRDPRGQVQALSFDVVINATSSNLAQIVLFGIFRAHTF